MITHEVPYSQGDVDRLYVPCNNGRRGMIKVEDCVEMEKREPEELYSNAVMGSH